MSFTNQMLGALGTATGALAAGQHIAEQKKANQLNELSQTEASYDEAKGLIKEADELANTDKQNLENIDATKEDLENSANWTGPFRDDKTGKFVSKDKYQTMRELALQEMQKQQEAIKTQKYDLTQRLELYNKRLNVLGLEKKGIAPDLNKLATPKQLNNIEYIKKGGKN